MNGNPMMRLHLWLETPDGLYFGLGRAQLLDLIERHGSLKKAADELNMSYRAAWGKIKKTEEVLGKPLIEKTAGNRHGYRLTEFGRQCMDAFVRWHQEVELFALQRVREIIRDDVRGFAERGGDTETMESSNPPVREAAESSTADGDIPAGEGGFSFSVPSGGRPGGRRTRTGS